MFLQKPLPWDVNEREVAPEWRWIWSHMHMFVPFWEQGGAPFAYGPNNFGTLINQADWKTTIRGIGVDCPGSDDYVTFPRNFFPDGEGTVFIAYVPTVTLGNFIFCYESDGIAASTYNGFGDAATIREIHLGVLGAKANFSWQDGVGGGDQVNLTEAADTVVGGQYNSTAGTWKDGGTHFLYQNGIERASGASASPYDQITPTVVRWGAPGDLAADREFDGTILVHYSLDIQLPGDVIAALHRDPFGPFCMADDVAAVFAVVTAGVEIFRRRIEGY